MNTLETLSELLSDSFNKLPQDYPSRMSEMDALSFIMAIENKLNVELYDEDIESVDSIEDLAELIDSQKALKAA